MKKLEIEVEVKKKATLLQSCSFEPDPDRRLRPKEDDPGLVMSSEHILRTKVLRAFSL